ncbi:MAG: LamG domain-containing protein, partial [Armatimonadota bacterium]|nr:LamG domain-containing protein [Armatimonadota bacterium]
LPNNPSIRVMAMTAAQNALDDTRPAGVMYEPELTDATLPKAIVLRRPTGPATAVYRLDALQTLDGTNAGPTQVDVPGLPTVADAPWTINLWTYMDTPPNTRTLLAGFGDATDTSGTQRYLGRITGGIHFWGGNVDIETGQPFDVGKWQMLTAVYDGATVSVYKNGEKLLSAPADLNEAAPVVQIAPAGPWGGGDHRFAGKLQSVTIWNGALNAAAIHALLAARPQG